MATIQDLDNFSFSGSTEQQILQHIVDMTAQAAQTKMRTDVDPQLIDASVKFQEEYGLCQIELQKIIKTLQDLDNIQKQLDQFLQSSPKADPDFIIRRYQSTVQQTQKNLNLRRAQEIGRRIVQNQEEYETVLNEILGHKMQVTFVTNVYKHGRKAEGYTYTGGEVYTFLPNQDYSQWMTYEFLQSKKNGKYSLSIRYDTDKMIDALEQLQRTELTQNYDSRIMDKLRWARFSTEWRYRRSKQYQTIQNASFGGLVLWQSKVASSYIRQSFIWHRNKWTGIWVQESANIAEAYASVIIHRQVGRFTSSNIEELLDIFILDYLQNVDYAPGAIVGDVSFQNVEYAIKATDGAFAGYTQFYKQFAKPIILGTNNFSKQKIQESYDKIKKDAKAKTKLVQNPAQEIGYDLFETVKDDVENKKVLLRLKM